MNINFIRILLAFLPLIAGGSGYAQSANPDFRLVLQNVRTTSATSLEFDLFIYTPNSTSFELALVQAGILVNPEFYTGGNLTASIVEGSSELNEVQKPQNILFVAETGIIKLPSRTLKPLPKGAKPEKRGTILSSVAPGTRICTIRLTNTVPFSKTPANFRFNFSKLPYPTTVSAYIEGVNTPLTCNDKNCLVK